MRFGGTRWVVFANWGIRNNGYIAERLIYARLEYSYHYNTQVTFNDTERKKSRPEQHLVHNSST